MKRAHILTISGRATLYSTFFALIAVVLLIWVNFPVGITAVMGRVIGTLVLSLVGMGVINRLTKEAILSDAARPLNGVAEASYRESVISALLLITILTLFIWGTVEKEVLAKSLGTVLTFFVAGVFIGRVSGISGRWSNWYLRTTEQARLVDKLTNLPRSATALGAAVPRESV